MSFYNKVANDYFLYDRNAQESMFQELMTLINIEQGPLTNHKHRMDFSKNNEERRKSLIEALLLARLGGVSEPVLVEKVKELAYRVYNKTITDLEFAASMDLLANEVFVGYAIGNQSTISKYQDLHSILNSIGQDQLLENIKNVIAKVSFLADNMALEESPKASKGKGVIAKILEWLMRPGEDMVNRKPIEDQEKWVTNQVETLARRIVSEDMPEIKITNALLELAQTFFNNLKKNSSWVGNREKFWDGYEYKARKVKVTSEKIRRILERVQERWDNVDSIVAASASVEASAQISPDNRAEDSNQANKASVAVPERVGGIDFDDKYLQMNLQGDAASIAVPQGFDWLLKTPIRGFTPKILDIQSGVGYTLSFFKGLLTPEQMEHAARKAAGLPEEIPTLVFDHKFKIKEWVRWA